MRTISELLTILRDNVEIDANGEIYDGLCYEIVTLHENGKISYLEYSTLRNYVYSNIPVIFKGLRRSPYGWPCHKWPPRLAWLNEHIELNKEKEKIMRTNFLTAIKKE